MVTRRNTLLIVGILAASFAGGAVSHWLLSPSPAIAQAADEEQAPQTVTAERFQLVDSEGTVRALLHVDDSGSGLVLHDTTGKARTAIGVNASGAPGVYIFDADGRPRAAMADGGGVFGVFISNAEGRLRTALADSGTGAGVIVYDANVETRGALLYLDEFDSATVTLKSAAGVSQAVLHGAENSPELGLYDAEGNMRVRLRQSAAAGPDVTLLDADGNETWQAP